MRAAKYITKYITKTLEDSLPGKKYLCSKGLNRATVLKTELAELENLPGLLHEIIGYEPELVYETEKENIYTGGKIRYMEFKK